MRHRGGWSATGVDVSIIGGMSNGVKSETPFGYSSPMETLFEQWPLVLILCFGIFVQSAAGFAAGLLIVPSLLWFGYLIPESQTSLLVATIPQNLWGVWAFRRSVSVRQVAFPGVLRIVSLPLGVWMLMLMETFPVVILRQIVGGVVVAMTLAILAFRPAPRERLHPLWAWIAFPISGFLQGLVGMGGPAMVFWVQAHDWGTKQSRAFLFAMYLTSIVPALGILYLFFGDRIFAPALVAAAMIPLLLVATYLGLQFGTWLGRRRLRRVTLVLLLLLGLSGLAAPWMTPG